MTPMHGPGTIPPFVQGLALAHPIDLRSIGSFLMSDSTFRLLERHQKLDEQLRRAATVRFVDPFEIARLKKLKLVIRDRLARIARMPATKH